MTQGDKEAVKALIRSNAQQIAEKPADPNYRLFDQVAQNYLLSISDQLWSEAQGHRTPWQGYGTFWDDVDEELEGMDLDIDDLL
jgi:hypothetical protein